MGSQTQDRKIKENRQTSMSNTHHGVSKYSITHNAKSAHSQSTQEQATYYNKMTGMGKESPINLNLMLD